MEKRIGSAIIMVEDLRMAEELNRILSRHSSVIIARQGIPLRDKQISVISLVLEGTTDEIGALTGQVGRLKDVQIKSVLTKYRNQDHETT